MKVKSLAVGMILPLAASVALATAPAASASTPTRVAVAQSGVQADHHRDGRDQGRFNNNYRRSDRDWRSGDDWRYNWRRNGDDYRYNWRRHGYGHRWISCYNPYIGWHRHYRWESRHRWDECNYWRW